MIAALALATSLSIGGADVTAARPPLNFTNACPALLLTDRAGNVTNPCAPPPVVSDATLTSINRQVNRSIEYQSDQAQYGRADVWRADPPSGLGDCEDYALTKMRRLLELGEPLADMRILIVTVRGQGHAVLEVRGRVLDNLSPWLGKPESYVTRAPAVSGQNALDRAGVR